MCGCGCVAASGREFMLSFVLTYPACEKGQMAVVRLADRDGERGGDKRRE